MEVNINLKGLEEVKAAVFQAEEQVRTLRASITNIERAAQSMAIEISQPQADADEVHLTAKVDSSAMDEVEHKAGRLNELLKETNSLADELASKGNITLSVEVEVES